MLPPPLPTQDTDAPIRLTDNDAALAKLSAVRQKYLSDPFIKYFVPRANFQPPRPPLINVGTFVRTVAIDDLVEQWIDLSTKEGRKCQIVSLGAGSDTRFWRLSVISFSALLLIEMFIDLILHSRLVHKRIAYQNTSKSIFQRLQ